MSRFKQGDRVKHPGYGHGIVEYVRPALGNGGRLSYFVRFQGQRDAIQCSEGRLYAEGEREVLRREEAPKRLHPLHDADSIARFVRNQGSYFPTERATGRSTVLALQFLAEALGNPYVPVKVEDHHGTAMADDELLRRVHMMAERLGLQYLVFNQRQCTLTFGAVR